MRAAVLPVLLAFVLAACVPEETLPPVGAEAVARDQALCSARGGIWGPGGKGGFACLTRTRDAGRQCRADTDCQGYCLARSRTCAPVTPLFGCHEILTASGARATLCVD